MENKFLILEAAMNTVLNINLPREIRIQELDKIEEYAKGLVNLPKDREAMLTALLKAFRHEFDNETISEECIGGYNRILKDLLSIHRSLKSQKCVIYGDNWLAQEIEKKMLAKNYCVFNWRMVNPAYINEYDLFILCDEPLKAYDIPSITEKDKIIKLWDYLKYKFIVFPSFYKTYMNYKKQSDDKVKCVITGNANTASAVRSNLLHTKAVSVANNAQDIYYDFKLFCHACESMPNVKYAVIGLAPYSLRYDASKSKVEWRRCLVYYPIVKTMHNCDDGEQLITLFQSEDEKMKQFFDEEYVEMLYDLYEEQKEESGEEESVFDADTNSQESTALNIREISELYNRPYMDILLENKVLLEEYAHFCQMKGIEIIFFIPPYTKWYKEHMKGAYYEELLKTVKGLCTKYNAKLVDMMQVDMDDCCFKDYADVNHVGAVKVASYINEILEG